MAALAFAPALFVAVENAPTAWAPLAALIGAVFVATADQLPSRRLVWAALMLLGIAGLTAVSAFWAIAPAQALVAARDLLGYAVATLVLIQCIEIFSPAQAARALDLLVVGVWIAAIVLIARELYFTCLAAPADFTAHTRTLHKITFYGAMFVALLLTQDDTVSLSLAAIVAFTTLTLGRSSGIDIALVIMFVFRVVSERTRRRALTCFIACTILAAVLAPLATSAAYAWLDSHGYLVFYAGTFAARLELWTVIARRVPESLIWGHGANTIRNAVGLAFQGKYYDLPDVPSAHNIVFDLWFELGLVGIVVYSLVLVALTRMIRTLDGLSHLLASSCLVTAIIELSVDHRIWLSWVMGALVFTATFCILHCCRGGPSRRLCLDL